MFCRGSETVKIISFMNVFILTSFGEISNKFGLHFLVNIIAAISLQDVLIGKLD